MSYSVIRANLTRIRFAYSTIIWNLICCVNKTKRLEKLTRGAKRNEGNG
ncbi:MAG TPA: hypothetical protein VK209_10945 [Candidatus Sulfotelmatobacter sp.]|nr:hypothetical protein [Candidatus Sulfotelmatobacter sp.]